jgi:hypothetical protein
MRQMQPSLVLHFETGAQPQPQAQPMLLVFRREGAMPGFDAEPRAQPEGMGEEPMMMDEDMDDMGAGCAIMTLATLALFVGLTTCCVRAAVAAVRRSRATVTTRQLLVDCSAGELSSPLLVVEERDSVVHVVAHTKA